MNPTSAFPNIATYLPAMAEKQAGTTAVAFPVRRDRHGRVHYESWTSSRLNEESDRLAHGLESIGIRRGVRTVLMVKPSLEFFALTFALFKVGAVPVLVDPGMGIRNLGQCLNEAEPEAFIGSPKAHAARLLFGWGRKTIRSNVTLGRRWLWGGRTYVQVRNAAQHRPYPLAETQAEETAAILFTSGSTGVPKGAVYTHAIFAAQVEILRQIYGIETGEIDLCTFPLFALFAPALGMTAIIPEMDFTRPALADPRKIIEAIKTLGVTNMFGSPALVDRVGRFGQEHGVKLPTLKRVISAGAPVSASVLERFSLMLAPGIQVFTPYGATEALPVCSIGSKEILDETRFKTTSGTGVCVGRPVPGIELAIIRITDEPIPQWSDELRLPAGQVGEIAVKGSVVTREYYNRPDATTLATIADAERSGFYHRMGDVGYIDERGRVWFCGRKSHRVVTANGTLFTIPCEGVFNAHPSVFRSALVGLASGGRKPPRAQDVCQPVLCVELEKHDRPANLDQLTRELLALGAAHSHTKDITTILYHPSFPVDIRHNAKINREKLAAWAARKLS